MSLYLLDTNTVSHFLNVQSPRHNPVIQRIGALADSEIVMVSILAIYEYSYGIENAPDEIKKRQLQRALAQLLQDIPVADLSIVAAAKYGELKHRRKRQLLTQSITSSTELRKAMRQYNVDLMIAASAITSHAVLVSADRGFIKMQLHICPELRLEDWTQ